MTPSRIPMFKPRLPGEAVERAVEVLESGWLGQGRKVAEFEEAFAAYVGARHCVAVSTGTAALHLAMRVLTLPEGTEVVTTPMTWVAAHHAILYERCRPVLADIQPATGNIDPEQIERKITPQTGALMVVHHSGYPCDLDEIDEIAARHGLPVIEDCAHAHGSVYRGTRIGGRSTLQCFSFGPTKNLTTIFGGAITTDDPDRVARLRSLRSLGFSRDTAGRSRTPTGGSYRPSYELTEVGFRYEMPDVNAAVGLGQLADLDEQNERRARVAGAYASGLAGAKGVGLLSYGDDRRSSYHMYPVLVEERDAVAERLHRDGIDVGVHYPLNTLLDHDDVPCAERFASRTLTLPLYPDLTDEDVNRVIGALRAG